VAASMVWLTACEEFSGMTSPLTSFCSQRSYWPDTC
jgi:hypothetical protein